MAGLYAFFYLKGRGHQGIFSLVKMAPCGEIENFYCRAPRRWFTGVCRAVPFVASVKYHACDGLIKFLLAVLLFGTGSSVCHMETSKAQLLKAVQQKINAWQISLLRKKLSGAPDTTMQTWCRKNSETGLRAKMFKNTIQLFLDIRAKFHRPSLLHWAEQKSCFFYRNKVTSQNTMCHGLFLTGVPGNLPLKFSKL